MSGLTRRRLIGRAGAAAGAAATAGLGLHATGAGARPRPRATADPAPSNGVWLPGDLHTHSCYSHDVFCAADIHGGTPGDSNPQDAYTAGLPVEGKFAEGRARGLKYQAVSDHNDVRSIADLGSAAQGDMIAIPTYEHSIQGHAHMLGATTLYDAGDQAADAINHMAGKLRANGGVFQANHPAYRLATDADFHACDHAGCSDCRLLNWTYDFDVRPDTVEVWNPSVARSDASETYYECWLDRGERIGATGGSDSHWVALHAVAGPGQPTTWVYSRDASLAGLLEGLRAGRTTISGQPPGLGGPQLLLSGPDAMIGDTVAPGTPLTVTAPGLAVPAVVRIRANGAQVLEQPLDPGGSVTFKAPSDAGWVRAILLARFAAPVDTMTSVGDATPQRDGMPMLALTSPIYVRRPGQGTMTFAGSGFSPGAASL